MREVILIGNPVAGGGAVKKIERAAALIMDRGFDVRVLLTGKRGDAEVFARRIRTEYGTQDTFPLVIAAGGDGTYNEIANGLAHSGAPMAILPLGTTSVLAKELSMPDDIAGCVDIALSGKAETVHLGKITFKDSNAQDASRCFLLMAGIGFDGQAIFGIHERAKRYAGKAAYILSGLNVVLHYDPPLLAISSIPCTPSHAPLFSTGYSIIISKASCYGGAFRVAPDAGLTDPCLSVFVTHKKGRLDLLRYVAGVVTGRHLKYPDISSFRASALSVEGSARIQIDGDYAGTTPAKIEVVRNALKLVTGS